MAISHWGVHLVKRDLNSLQVIASVALNEIGSSMAPRPSTLSLEGPQGRFSLHSSRAQQISEMISKFCVENRRVSLDFILFPFKYSRLTYMAYENLQKSSKMTDLIQSLLSNYFLILVY